MRLASENTKFSEILKRALEQGGNYVNGTHYLSSEASDARAYSAELWNLARQVIAHIRYKHCILLEQDVIKKWG